MKQLSYSLLIICTLLYGVHSFAQEIIADKGSYGIDTKHKIIVWHQKDLDSIVSINKKITTIKFNKNFKLKEASNQLSYTEGVSVTNGEDYVLYISKIPLIHITIDTSTINSDSKIPGYFTYFNNNEYLESVIGVRQRGNLSLGFPKKSFDLEFWTDGVSKEKKDVKFKGMRSDDDWILDGMYNEPLRLRSHIATNLWTKIHKPYYAEKEPKAKSGFEVKYVEVFKNNEYFGIYQFSESVDRKQLKLKKNVGKIINGKLYKANSYDGGPDFSKSPAKFNNIFPHWNGWKTEYPFINYTSDFENLSQFTGLVVNGTDEAFSKNIEKEVHITNAIDYYLLVNVLRATDNLGKNYYLGKYDKDEPYFFTPWDLDGVLGVIQDGKRERITDNVLGNGLFNRLLEVNPNNYKAKVKARWIALRTTAFSNEDLLSRIDKVYAKFTEEKVYEREQLVWKNKLNEETNKEHYNYLKLFLEDRLLFLDTYFKTL
ncbi:CotH kinase family protein [Lacinutrix sp. Bg11-31]|uniref:CotH kinase family protein n=1 Tax=Lacinutrix sp. Bg11-31 TaxID=2057808 RepID=UPI000C31A251|nr:CotH kinase family protein [Lacinutrix sp. Bg11-31]AUC80888.1 spore coat protein CotH [Lacinutrix sp. Bg11-31]